MNAREVMVVQLATKTYAWILNVEKEFVLVESVSVMKITLAMEMFALIFVMVSIVEPAVIVREEFVAVMNVLSTLIILVLTCVKASIVEAAVTAQVVSVPVKQDISRLEIFVKKHVRLILVRN